jgi:hypothetical protein
MSIKVLPHISVWSILKAWLGLHDVDTRDWHDIVTVKDGWVQSIHKRGESGGKPWIHLQCWFQAKYGRK